MPSNRSEADLLRKDLRLAAYIVAVVLWLVMLWGEL